MFNKKVFVLEDDPARVQHFREVFANAAELTIIDTCADTDKFQPPYDAIFLDHDLGGRQMTDGRCVHCGSVAGSDTSCAFCKDGTDAEDCGTQFVTLVKDKLALDDIVIIHSYNSEGAKRMLALLPAETSAVYVPFRGKAFDAIVEMLLEAWRAVTPVKGGKKHA